jgi:hypothetical protein
MEVQERRLKKVWLSKIGTVMSKQERRTATSLEQFDTESSHALGEIQEFGAFRDIGISLDEDPHSAERCDDAPVVKAFRIKEFEARMMLQDLEGQQTEGFKRNVKTATATLKSLKGRLKACVAGVKKASQSFKTDIRNMLADESEAYDAHGEAVDALIEELEAIRDDALALINSQRDANSYTLSQYRKNALEVQAGLWHERWLLTSRTVNQILAKHWKNAESAIKQEVSALGYDDADGEAWDFDYIGSLAKGVKGPPKQHIAFDADKFDVDANLEARSLSEYALTQAAPSKVDRGAIKGRDANLLKIKALKSFQDAIHRDLCELPGYDQSEEFEVFVKAEPLEADVEYEELKAALIKLKGDYPDHFKAFVTEEVRARLDEDGAPDKAHTEWLMGELAVFAGERHLDIF